MCRRWVKAGHQVTVLTCAPNVPHGRVYQGYKNHWRRVEQIDGVRVVRVWTYLAANSGALRRMLNFLSFQWNVTWQARKEERPDLVIATSPQFFCGLAGVRVARKNSCPFILEIRDLWPESIAAVTGIGSKRYSLTGLGIRYLARLETKMYAAARHIVTVGPGYRGKLMERGVKPEKISVITNGVDLEDFRPQPAVEQIRLVAGAKARATPPALADFLVGYIGTVGMAHGLEVVIEAARLARDRDLRQLKFVVVGGGARLAELQKMLRLDDPGNLRFVGLRPKTEMRDWLASVDVCLVHLRDSELFQTVLPSKMFEAMAMKKPIALGVRGDAKRLLLEAQGGLAFEPGNAQALLETVQALHRSWQDPPLAARQFVEAHYNLDRLAERYAEVLESNLER